MARHLIGLIDGTWVSADTSILNQTYSNIYKLGMLMSNYSQRQKGGKREANVVFYSRGLGAQKSKILRYTSGGFAAGLDEEIADVYINLASNYQRHDKIYLFGFSRGAVIARAVAGIVGMIGLLEDRHINCYKDVWDTYRKGHRPSRTLIDKCHKSSPKIEFLGVFDTVYGGNDTRRRRLRRLGFHNEILPETIKYAVHILALDDRRTFFKPIPWSAGSADNAEQIWMPGVHSDIGGTCVHEFLGDVSLLTMIDRIRSKTYLKFYEDDLDLLHDKVTNQLDQNNIVIANEMGSRWWKLARRASRTYEANHLNQFIHPITDAMKDREVHYKGRRRQKYQLHPSFTGLKSFSELEFYQFREAE